MLLALCLVSVTTPVPRRSPSFIVDHCTQGTRTMKKIKKLGLQKETLRRLASTQLEVAVGGLSGDHCTYGLTGCAACPPQRPSLRISNCQACYTDICSFE